MKGAKLLFHIAILLLVVGLAYTSCTVQFVDLDATRSAGIDIRTAVAATLTSVAATQTAQVTPIDTTVPPTAVALKSFHGRYVTAMRENGDWSLRQETELSDCGWFTQQYLDDDKIALVTCHGRYVTAPRRGTTRWDWELWQESGLGECGQFDLHDLGHGEVAFETCAGNFFTAGDGYWPGELAWSVVAETDRILDWERFTVVKP